MMYCAECGKLIESIKCCNGLGYWYNKPPLPTDYIKLNQYKGYYLYISGFWPANRKVIKPNIGK